MIRWTTDADFPHVCRLERMQDRPLPNDDLQALFSDPDTVGMVEELSGRIVAALFFSFDDTTLRVRHLCPPLNSTVYRIVVSRLLEKLKGKLVPHRIVSIQWEVRGMRPGTIELLKSVGFDVQLGGGVVRASCRLDRKLSKLRRELKG